MLRSMRQTLGYPIQATDGEIGKTVDYYFEDDTWRIRYLVARAGSWLSGREVLISPLAVGTPDWLAGAIPVNLTMKQVRESPSIDTDQPVSRRHEARLAEYYNWLPYWEMPGVMMPVPAGSAAIAGEDAADIDKSHLRSLKDVIGYRLQATDGEIGGVSDFLAQTDIWAIRYLVADLSRWRAGQKVLVSPAWTTAIEWAQKRFCLDLSVDQIRGSQPFDPAAGVNREYEVRLYDYYGRPKYWETKR
jgi:hypothetical protein